MARPDLDAVDGATGDESFHDNEDLALRGL